MLNELCLVICQHQNDANRFASLGIDKSKISVTGSVKYDLDIEDSHLIKGKAHKQALTQGQKVWIAASTHEGEDARLLTIHRNIRKVFPDALLILVPRHPERFEAVYQLSLGQKFLSYKRSLCEYIPADAEVFVVDSMGELLDFYAASDIAFIGGSLVEVGGHNPIEPGALGLPIIMGPYVFNFEAICQQLISVGGLLIAENDQKLEGYVLSLMADSDKVKQIGDAALAEIDASKGAVLRVVDALSPLLDQTHQGL
jgi:3-deoxy-D-manno-octulosonic-acid transferase